MSFLSNIWNKNIRKNLPGGERREAIRLTAHHLVRYKVVDRKEELAFAKNISKGGALFHSREEFKPGTMVELLINFPGYPNPIKALTKVVRTIPLTQTGGFDVAVEFVNVDEDAKDFIRKKILAASTEDKKKRQK